MGRIIDVSMEVFSGMVVWPGDDEVHLSRTQKMEEGARNNVSRIHCSVHTGTHVDAPFHFLPGGETVDRLPMEALLGPAWVAEFPTAQRIGDAELESAGVPAGVERLLLKTVNSAIPEEQTAFMEEYAGLTESGAKWVAKRGIRLLGSDYLSVACRDQTGPVHNVLLGAGIVLVEGLRLGNVPKGDCRFSCLPLKLKGSDGAPARALIEVE
jgi:arylformamidase